MEHDNQAQHGGMRKDTALISKVLDEQSLAELEAMSADFREQIARDPQHSRVEQVQLEDLEWEMEKRRWQGGLIGFGRRLSNASVIALHHALTSTVGSWRLSPSLAGDA